MYFLFVFVLYCITRKQNLTQILNNTINNNNNNNNNKLLYSHISKKHIDSTTVKHK